MRSSAIALCCLLALGFLNTPALEAQAKKNLGLVGGMTSTDFRAQSLDSTFSAKIDWLLGGTAGITWNRKWGVRLEALYVNKGTRVTATLQDWKASYIQIPLLAQLNVWFSEFTTGRFVVSGGPTVAFNVSCDFADVKCSDVQGASRVLNGTDFTLMGSLAFGSGPVLFDVRYDLGLVNINTVSGGPDTKTRAFWVTLTYQFPLGN